MHEVVVTYGYVPWSRSSRVPWPPSSRMVRPSLIACLENRLGLGDQLAEALGVDRYRSMMASAIDRRGAVDPLQQEILAGDDSS